MAFSLSLAPIRPSPSPRHILILAILYTCNDADIMFLVVDALFIKTLASRASLQFCWGAVCPVVPCRRLRQPTPRPKTTTLSCFLRVSSDAVFRGGSHEKFAVLSPLSVGSYFFIVWEFLAPASWRFVTYQLKLPSHYHVIT